MRRVRKIVSISLLIVCFTSTLFGCTNSNEVTDSKETTTVADNETKATTTKETEPATEEPTTEEPTEYVFKGEKWFAVESQFDLFNNLTLESGDVIFINDYETDPSDDFNGARGGYLTTFLVLTKSENEKQILEEVSEKYMEVGDANIYIPYADNYSFEYIGDKKVIFHFVEYDERGYAVFDVYKE